MLNEKQKFGEKSESIAAKYLSKNHGYKILKRNYRNQLGEIDIIAKDGDTLVFVEVKAARTEAFGNPKCAVTPKKQRKISMVALYYLKSTGQCNAKARFDVAAIRFCENRPIVEVVKNAFELAYR
jgi:putative endonuclease